MSVLRQRFVQFYDRRVSRSYIVVCMDGKGKEGIYSIAVEGHVARQCKLATLAIDCVSLII